MNSSRRQNSTGQRLLGLTLVITIFVIFFGLSWLGNVPHTLAQNEELPLARRHMETIYIPAVVAPSAKAEATAAATRMPTATSTATLTTTPRSIPTNFATATSTQRPTEIATSVPTPTSTTTGDELLRFEGSTNQGHPVVVEALADLSAVTKLEIDAQIICPNSSGTVELRITDQFGFAIRNDRFMIRSDSPGGNEQVIMGALEGNGALMSGSWSIWLDGVEPFQPCNNKGTWSARNVP